MTLSNKNEDVKHPDYAHEELYREYQEKLQLLESKSNETNMNEHKIMIEGDSHVSG